MRDSSERPLSDPLLQVDGAPRDARGVPVRAPLGNSILTLVSFVVLALVGAGVWWLRRPVDISTELGGREWVIVDVDGEPATNQLGTVSTFVLDGTHEVRAVDGCNVATGDWQYRPGADRLAIDWTTQTELVCPDDWPATYLPDGGEVELDAGVLRLTSNDGGLRAISLDDHDAITGEGMAGDWTIGGDVVEIGRRGLFRIGECRGSWRALRPDVDGAPTEDDETDEAIEVRFEDAHIDRDCDVLSSIWADSDTFRAVEFDGSLYLRRDRSVFPLDREILRLDRNEDNGVVPPASP